MAGKRATIEPAERVNGEPDAQPDQRRIAADRRELVVSAAQEHGRQCGVPEPQLDWTD
jgi:hypothetical protein